MTEIQIGFGLIDRRTAIVVLFTMVIALAAFQLQVPIDQTSLITVFVSFVLLTGYLYLARCIYRFPVAVLCSVAFVVTELKPDRSRSDKRESEEREPDSATPNGVEPGKPKIRVNKIFRVLLLLLAVTVGLPVFISYLVLTFGEWIEEDRPSFLDRRFIASVGRIFSILDRIGLIVISALATIPTLQSYVRFLGVTGLAVMVVVYTLRGDFTSLVRDFITIEEEERRQVPTVRVTNSELSPLYVQTASNRYWD